MTAAPAFNDDALLFVDSKKGGLRKRNNRHLFGCYMPQLDDDDLLLSTSLYNATPHVIWQERPYVKTRTSRV